MQLLVYIPIDPNMPMFASDFFLKSASELQVDCSHALLIYCYLGCNFPHGGDSDLTPGVTDGHR